MDGLYYRRIEFTDAAGVHHPVEKVFFTNKLSSALLTPKIHGEFYFWNSHCYAIRRGKELTEDIDAVRASFFTRDARLLLLMALSVFLLPVALFVVSKKLLRASSRRQMQSFLEASHA